MPNTWGTRPVDAGVGHLPHRLDDAGQAAPADHDSDVHLVTAQPAGDEGEVDWQLQPPPVRPSAGPVS